MDLSYFLRSVVIGFSIASVVGPIGMLCIHRTLHKGFTYGFVTGLGAATADALYGSIAAFGLTLVTSFLTHQLYWIHLVGGLFLLYLGIHTILTKPTAQAAKIRSHSFTGTYTSTLFLTITNPQTIISFAAIFAGIGLVSNRHNYIAALLAVCGIFLGSTLWWCVLSGGINLLHGKITQHWFLWINRLSGSIILLFGLFALFSLTA
jgi:threonine/homoserine/homoserine lactone efflux protein